MAFENIKNLIRDHVENTTGLTFPMPYGPNKLVRDLDPFTRAEADIANKIGVPSTPDEPDFFGK